MKKVLAMILVLASVLSLCACGNDDYYVEEEAEEEVTPTTEATQPQIEPAPPAVEAPTAEEDAQLMEYAEALCRLMDYRNGVSNSLTWEVNGESCHYSASYPDSRVMETLFQLVMNAAAVDKYAGTEYAADYPILNWNRTEVLGWFGQISNVLLYTQRTDMDALGNANDPYLYTVWGYDPDGAQISPERGEGHLIEIGLPLVDTDPSYTYNICREVREETGSLVALEYYDLQDSSKAVQVRMTPNYDENGRLIRLDAMRASGQTYQIFYTYDDAGNLTRQHTEGLFSNHSITYTYDAAGRITAMNQDDEWFRSYTYDETTGRLTSAGMQKRYDTYVSVDIAVTYAYDNLGRVVKTFCQDLLAGGQAQTIYELVYGDYYFLQPVA